MEKKKEKDDKGRDITNLKYYIMEEKVTYYAYLTIHDFFDCFVFDSVRHKIDSVIRSATGNKIWDKQPPGELVYYMEKLQNLCSAAFVIHCDFSTKEEVILDAKENEHPDIFKTGWFFNGSFRSSEWNNIPRNLSAQQYHDPYKAIKKFCSYMPEPQWQKTLQALSIYALCNDSVLDTFPPYNILTLRLRLLQLIEACHLINVRIKNQEKKQEDGEKKVKTKKRSKKRK
jgi:hypothetical protein